MKKFLAILFTFLYFNVVFGTGVDCCYCAGKLVKANLHFSHGKSGGCSSGHMMSCCDDETVICNSDPHQTQNISYSFSSAPTEYNTHTVIVNVLYLWDGTTDSLHQITYHYLIKATSSRHTLALIHTLRI